MAKGKWIGPGTTQESGGPLAAFGWGAVPVTSLTRRDPAVSERQRKFMGAELARKRARKKTRTELNEAQLREFAKTRKRGDEK